MAEDMKTVSFRCDPELYEHLRKIQRQAPLGLHDWIRTTLRAAANRDFPQQSTPPWELSRMPDGVVVAVFRGDTRFLPPVLVHQVIRVGNAVGMTRTATVRNVVSRTANVAIVDID